MTLLMTILYDEQAPKALRNKTWVATAIRKAPIGRHSYDWWLDYFQTVLRGQWDIS